MKGSMKFWILLNFLVFVTICEEVVKSSDVEGRASLQGGSESHCALRDDGSLNCDQEENYESYKLFRWDPVHVGYEREIELEIGKKHIMVTKAMNPPVFVVENYLENYECEHIINKANATGMFSSQVHNDPETVKSKDYARYELKDYSANFDNYDLNQDDKINLPAEIQQMAYNINYLYLTESEVDEIVTKFNINVTTDQQGKCITRENFKNINLAGMHEYFNDLRENHPQHRDRFSEQIWLSVHNNNDQIISRIMEKLKKLTRLHNEIVEGTEPIQVLRYMPYGHYHAHFDSQNKSNFPDFPCCHTLIGGAPSNCRICRFLTALVYLNDVQKGGETAFPVADDPTYLHEEYLKRRKGDMYNLSRFCHNGTLVVAPKKGMVVMWYNHLVSEEGFLGPLDPYSLHGGCDVIEGEKWIANNWIPAPDSPNLIHHNVYSPDYKRHTNVKSEDHKPPKEPSPEEIYKVDL